MIYIVLIYIYIYISGRPPPATMVARLVARMLTQQALYERIFFHVISTINSVIHVRSVECESDVVCYSAVRSLCLI